MSLNENVPFSHLFFVHFERNSIVLLIKIDTGDFLVKLVVFYGTMPYRLTSKLSRVRVRFS